jgi:hypothetical protein
MKDGIQTAILTAIFIKLKFSVRVSPYVCMSITEFDSLPEFQFEKLTDVVAMDDLL